MRNIQQQQATSYGCVYQYQQIQIMQDINHFSTGLQNHVLLFSADSALYGTVRTGQCYRTSLCWMRVVEHHLSTFSLFLLPFTVDEIHPTRIILLLWTNCKFHQGLLQFHRSSSPTSLLLQYRVRTPYHGYVVSWMSRWDYRNGEEEGNIRGWKVKGEGDE